MATVKTSTTAQAFNATQVVRRSTAEVIKRLDGVKIEGCNFEYRKGDTHPYYYGRIDIQPNVQTLEPAPFKAGDLIYTEGATNVTLDGKNI